MSSGLGNLPLKYVWVDGKENTSWPTDPYLPTREALNGSWAYSQIMSYFTTNTMTPGEVHELGKKQLSILYPMVSLITDGFLDCCVISVSAPSWIWFCITLNLPSLVEFWPPWHLVVFPWCRILVSLGGVLPGIFVCPGLLKTWWTPRLHQVCDRGVLSVSLEFSCIKVIVIVFIVIFLGQFCPRGKVTVLWGYSYVKHQPVRQGQTTTPGTTCPTLFLWVF